MNKKTGMYASAITFFAVFSFALCMLLGFILKNDNIGKNVSYISSIFIAFGYIAMTCSFLTFIKKENKAPGLIAFAFAIMYGVFILMVYYAQITTIRLSNLSGEISNLIDYSKYGLFFNYDLLGYGFMSVSTFFIGIKLETKNKSDKALKYLLCIHGIFAISCFIMPVTGVFNPGLSGADSIGTIILSFWCIYFIPVCILSFVYFRKQSPKID